MSTAEIQKEDFGFPQQPGESFSGKCCYKLFNFEITTVWYDEPFMNPMGNDGHHQVVVA
jgi:hypothetical protein